MISFFLKRLRGRSETNDASAKEQTAIEAQDNEAQDNFDTQIDDLIESVQSKLQDEAPVSIDDLNIDVGIVERPKPRLTWEEQTTDTRPTKRMPDAPMFEGRKPTGNVAPVEIEVALGDLLQDQHVARTE